MATEIKYKGAVISSPEPGQTATLKCEGMRMESDVVVEVGEQGEVVEEYTGAVRDGQSFALTTSDGYVITDNTGLKLTTPEE